MSSSIPVPPAFHPAPGGAGQAVGDGTVNVTTIGGQPGADFTKQTLVRSLDEFGGAFLEPGAEVKTICVTPKLT